MPLEVSHPGFLWGLLGLGFIIWWHRHTLAPFSPGRRRLSFVVRSVIYILAVLALTEPRWMQQRRETHVIWLADVSRSAGKAAVEAAQKLATQATDVKSQSWIAFAGRPALAKDGKSVAELAPSTLQDDRTDLSDALKFAEASFPLGYARTVVLV